MRRKVFPRARAIPKLYSARFLRCVPSIYKKFLRRGKGEFDMLRPTELAGRQHRSRASIILILRSQHPSQRLGRSPLRNLGESAVGHWRNNNTPAETTSRRAGAQQWNGGLEGPAYRLAASCPGERTGSSVEEGGDGLLWSPLAGRPEEGLPGWPLTLFCLVKGSSRRFSATYSAVWLVARSSGRPTQYAGPSRSCGCSTVLSMRHTTQSWSIWVRARVVAPACRKTPAAVGGHLRTRERHQLHQPWQGAGDAPRRLPFCNEIHAAGQSSKWPHNAGFTGNSVQSFVNSISGSQRQPSCLPHKNLQQHEVQPVDRPDRGFDVGAPSLPDVP